MVSHEEKLSLAKELLDDIELTRLSGQPLMLKSLRLARLIENEGLEKYVRWELHGYPRLGEDEAADTMLGLTGRKRVLKGEDSTYYLSLGQLIAWVEQAETALSTSKIDSLSGDYLIPVTNQLQRTRNAYVEQISRGRQIEATVIAWLHDMISSIHGELVFSGEQSGLFLVAQAAVDARLATLGGSALEKIESIYERLATGSDEAISHALTTCRRLITSVADALYPPQKEPITVGGKEIKLTAQQPLNRLETYIADHTSSRSRRRRLRRSLEDLFDRASSGVHSDVSAEEAKHLFLQTYVVLGEIVLLGQSADPDSGAH